MLLTAPVASNFNFNHLLGHSQTVDFNIPVHNILNPLEDADLTLQRIPLDTNVPASSIVLEPSTGTHRTFRFTNMSGSSGPTILPDGNWRASIAYQEVVAGTIENPEPMSSDAIADFWVFAGDANHDGDVDLDDFNIVATNFNTTGKDFSQGNFDYDPAGNVNLDDFNLMAARFGTSVSPPATAPDEIRVDARPDFKFDTSWLDQVTGEQGWRVQWSFTGQFDDAQYRNLDPDSTGWITDAFGDGTRVWFRSRAYGNGQDTAYTPKRYAITHLPVPTITSVIALSSTQIKIEFTDNSQNEDYFQVYRSLTSVGGFVPVGDPILSGAPTRFIDSGLTPGATYYYDVRARNAVIDSSPQLPSPSATTQAATAFIDLDVWEDVNGDFIHDNSAAAELLEGNQPTELPFMQEDGDYEELALVVDGAVPGATVTFNYADNQIQLYQDLWGTSPINPGDEWALSSFGITAGSGTAVVFAKLTSGPETFGALTAQVGGGSSGTTYALGGGVTRRTGGSGRPDNPIWHDNLDNDNGGGLDDGDGNQELTERDGFWTTNWNKHTLIIGFAGHTQSLGFGHAPGPSVLQGAIWNINVDPDPLHRFINGAYAIGLNIKNQYPAWAVTMFPEDPGNADSTWTDWCGDGVLGAENWNRGGARVDAQNQKTGALAFLIDAIKNHAVDHVGLFGYSHGAGSVQILMQLLGYEASRDSTLLQRLGGVNFFWSAYIDGVDVELNFSGGQFDARGRTAAEREYPISYGYGVSVGTYWHYNAYQRGTIPFHRDGVPVNGTELDPNLWQYTWHRNPDYLWQDVAEPWDPLGRWPNGTDHSSRIDNRGRIRGRGIAEDPIVQQRVSDSLFRALFDTY